MDPKELVGLIKTGAESRNETRLFGLKGGWRIKLRHMPRNQWSRILGDNTEISYSNGKRQESLNNDGVRSALIRNVVIDWTGLTPDVLRKVVYLPEEVYAQVAGEGEIAYDPALAEILLREGAIDGMNLGSILMDLVLNPELFSNGLLEGQVKNLSSAPGTISIQTG
jgi:hypothetical protein